ncbi:AraC family transcriptional regulator N-terminal domain-containing protein [Streptomyces sp. NPDC051217]|uniref:AraC family transcriptional regulator n=1 Tax=Streptomyces sp. NPDC051217 TaxID=3365644 RepID=UPI00379E94CE
MDTLAELQVLISRYAAVSGWREHFSGIEVTAADAPTQPMQCVADPMFVLVAGGAKQVMVNDSALNYGAGQYLVVSAALPITAHITRAGPDEPFVSFAMALKPAAIAALLLETAEFDGTCSDPGGMAISDAPFALTDSVVRLLRLFDSPSDARALGPAVEREILWRLITGAQGPMVRHLGLADSSLSRVSRTIHWIRRYYDESVRIEELAEMAKMSQTLFHRHFKSVTGLTPIQYQKKIRLQEARILLRGSPRDVAGVGFAVGYESASQFSREYRRQFGVTPSEDVAHAKRAASGA